MDVHTAVQVAREIRHRVKTIGLRPVARACSMPPSTLSRKISELRTHPTAWLLWTHRDVVRVFEAVGLTVDIRVGRPRPDARGKPGRPPLSAE